MKGFEWATASPAERASMIRRHRRGERPLSLEQVRKLFGLTPEGLTAILDGADWRQEFEAPETNCI